jgi:hypothetical protein
VAPVVAAVRIAAVDHMCFEPREQGVEGVSELAELISAAR